MKIRQQYSTKTANIRRGHTNTAEYLTVHQTGNRRVGANARAHADLQSTGNVRVAAWHAQGDDTEIVESYPDDVVCWHAGDGVNGPGNNRSTGLELCINADGDYLKTLKNGAEYAAYKLRQRGHGIDRLKKHQDWTGKKCPEDILAGIDGITWTVFVALVKAALDAQPAPVAVKPPAANVAPTTATSTTAAPAAKPAGKTIEQMAKEIRDGKHGDGHENRRKSLGVSAAVYAQVCAEVNRQLKVTPAKTTMAVITTAKTIEQMASEVIIGKHGEGHATRRQSLGVSAAVYEQVRAAVNRRWPKK